MTELLANPTVRSGLLIAFAFGYVLQILPLMIWLERKVCAYIQDRVGPNRAAVFGVIRLGGAVHSLTDAIKLLTKEDIRPAQANRFFYLLAPWLVVTPALFTMAIIPWADDVRLPGGDVFAPQIARLDVGMLFAFAVAGLTVFGILLAGWASNNKFSLLGGLRAASQLISYEIALTLAAVSMMVWYGTVRLETIVAAQSEIWRWGIVWQPLAFVIFLIAVFAESNRVPFDLPEGESELVAGYHTEYTGFKFAIFMMTEYVHMIVSSIIVVTIFFGGWQIPGWSTAELRANAPGLLQALLTTHAIGALLIAIVCLRRFIGGPRRWQNRGDFEPLIFGVVLLVAAIGMGAMAAMPPQLDAAASAWIVALAQLMTLTAKASFFLFLFLWVRWTLPRFRFDQVMRLGWKMLMPLALLNIVVTAGAIAFSGGRL